MVSAQPEPSEELIEKPEEAPIASEESAISFEESTAGEISGISETAPTTQEAIPEWLQEVLEPLSLLTRKPKRPSQSQRFLHPSRWRP